MNTSITQFQPGTAGSIGFKILLMLLAVACLGLPVNTLWHFFLLLAAMIAIVTLPAAAMPAHKARSVIAILFSALLLNNLLPRAAIEEGHNIFLADDVRSSVLPGQLPPPVYTYLKLQFDRVYPPDQRCTQQTAGCWRSSIMGWEPPPQAYAQSFDDVFRHAKYSRVVDQIDFAGLTDLRGGFVNEAYYHWWGDDRLKRETMPYFVMYELNSRLVGSSLCWSGELLWEEEAGQFAASPHDGLSCRPISENDIGKKVYGIGIDPARPLAMQLHAGVLLKFSDLARECIKLFALTALLALTLNWQEWRRLLLPSAFVGATAGIAAMYVPAMFHGYTVLQGAEDGLTHEGLGREILRRLLAGDIVGALQGGENIFYFTPGWRYLRALGLVMFGETNLGYLGAMLALPLAVFGVARLLMPRSWSYAALPPASIAIFQCFRFADKGYGDPLGYMLFLGAVWLTLNPSSRPDLRWPGYFVLALSVFVRPNLAIAALLLIMVRLWLDTRTQPLFKALPPVIGFGFISLVPLHNIVFGHRFVPLTSEAYVPANLKAPPAEYLHALADMLGGNWSGTSLELVTGHLLHFAASWWLFAVLLGLAAWAQYRRVHTPLSAGLLLVTAGMFVPFLFYDAKMRLALLAWLSAIILCTACLYLLRNASGKNAGQSLPAD